jgi:hypothetical protein
MTTMDLQIFNLDFDFNILYFNHEITKEAYSYNKPSYLKYILLT